MPKKRPWCPARVVRARHLLDVVQAFLPPGAEPPPPSEGWAVLQAQPPRSPTGGPDMADVKGQTVAPRAGDCRCWRPWPVDGGPAGSGKSMLAQRFAGLLPAMQVDEALESAAAASLAGSFRPEDWAAAHAPAPPRPA